MAGISNLQHLLSSLTPILQDGEFVFCSSSELNPDLLLALNPIATFQETEGLSFIVARSVANNYATENGWQVSAPQRLITLGVHSSLDAVGLTAVVSAALAEAGISCNICAAFYHDHLFIPAESAQSALQILKQLAKATD